MVQFQVRGARTPWIKEWCSREEQAADLSYGFSVTVVEGRAEIDVETRALTLAFWMPKYGGSHTPNIVFLWYLNGV